MPFQMLEKGQALNAGTSTYLPLPDLRTVSLLHPSKSFNGEVPDLCLLASTTRTAMETCGSMLASKIATALEGSLQTFKRFVPWLLKLQ